MADTAPPQPMRRPSLSKTSLRQQPIAEAEEVFADTKLPPLSSTPLVAAETSPAAQDSPGALRRASRDSQGSGGGGGGGSRRSSNIAYGANVLLLRRTSQARRLSVRGRTAEPQADHLEQLSRLVPLPQSPRFTSTMSVEAQYSILKGYEDRLWRQLCSAYPDYEGLLHRSQTPRNGHVLLRDLAPRPTDGAGAPAEPRPGSPDEDEPGDDVVDGSRSSRSLPVPAGLGLRRPPGMEMPKSARDERNTRVPHHRQLGLSRRLAMAQSLLDAFADATCALTSQPACRPSKTNFNVVQGYNSWANAWQEEFQIKEPSLI